MIWVARALLLVVLLVFVHRWYGFLHSDLNQHADEAAHYTSGVMVHDYLFQALGKNPMSFAREFYWRHPKVAIGHWPPGYYALEGLWFGIFGITLESARLLVLAILLACAVAVWWSAREDYAGALVFVAAAAFLAMPMTRNNVTELMTDAAITLFSLFALSTLRRAISKGQSTAAYAAFVICTLAALWIKGSGWAILPAALALPLFTGHSEAYRSVRFYFALGTTVVGGMPFYLWSETAGIGYPLPALGLSPASSAAGAGVRFAAQWQRRVEVLAPVFQAIPIWMIAAAVASCIFCIWRKRNIGVALAGIAGQAALQILAPSTIEARYYLPTLAWIVILVALGLQELSTATRVPWLGTVVFTAATLLALERPASYARQSYDYRQVVQEMGCDHCVTLAASDPIGEGGLISSELSASERNAVVLRGTKVLATADWSGDHYRSKFASAQDLKGWLESKPIDFVVIDPERSGEMLHIKLCRAALASSADYRLDSPPGTSLKLYRRTQPFVGARQLDRSFPESLQRVSSAF